MDSFQQITTRHRYLIYSESGNRTVGGRLRVFSTDLPEVVEPGQPHRGTRVVEPEVDRPSVPGHALAEPLDGEFGHDVSGEPGYLGETHSETVDPWTHPDRQLVQFSTDTKK